LIGYQFNIDEIIHCLGKLKPICGRLERVFLKQAENTNIFLDYAHTPDALEKVLLALKETFAKKIILVFGCGGDRDPGKRKEMGIIASKLADHIIVTSDNPRSENPAQIMLHIVSAITTPYLMIENRSEAIKRAIQLINHDNILLIAGKGHEEYQEIEGKKIPYSDRETVLRVLKKNGTT
jgi:UDP-N-acetylmuramoyl-L-alanyl-D-glutamate--2,6-diaminopimelate ligase